MKNISRVVENWIKQCCPAHIVQHCYTRLRAGFRLNNLFSIVDNIEQCGVAQHCSILFSTTRNILALVNSLSSLVTKGKLSWFLSSCWKRKNFVASSHLSEGVQRRGADHWSWHTQRVKFKNPLRAFLVVYVKTIINSPIQAELNMEMMCWTWNYDLEVNY